MPEAVSLVNSYWLRGYPNPPPDTLIVVGFSSAQAETLLERCEIAGQITNQYGIENEETGDHRDVFICRRPCQPWEEFWKNHRSYG